MWRRYLRCSTPLRSLAMPKQARRSLRHARHATAIKALEIRLKSAADCRVDDWYLATQIRKFRSGVRGTNPKDAGGRLMRPMARTLANEDAIRNVVAYIGTLKP